MTPTSLDLTQEFKQLVSSKEKSLPSSLKRQRIKFNHPSSSSSTTCPYPDAWTTQATQVATNLTSFSQFLSSIRRPYLDLSSSSSSSTSRGGFDSTKQGFAMWEGVKSLSDRERDEIDFSVKIALRKSVERVRELEQLEKVRIANEKKLRPPPSSSSSSSSGFSRFFSSPPSSSPETSTSESLSSHRAFITLYLNTLLQRVSERQRIQQETRVTRQLEKSSSLGGLGGGGALGMDRLGREMAESAAASHRKRGSKGKGKEEEEWESREASQGQGEGRGHHQGGVPSIYKPLNGSFEDQEEEEDEQDGLNQLGTELTREQILQFEAEESELLRATQTDLESLKTAESSLLEISSLQTQLAVHLSQQSELTDKLWEEVQEVNGRVGEGNQQLKKAKERGRDSRVWLLVFLFGSSFTLLFLDYYSS